MKKADAIIQPLLLVLVFTFGYFLLYLQLIAMLWQLVSAIEMIVRHEKYPERHYRKAKMYMISFFVYLFGFVIVWTKGCGVLMVSWFFSSWLLMLFYAVFTILVAFEKTPKRKTFMDIM